MSTDRILLATDSQPPPDLGAQASMRRTRKHQTRVAELVVARGGEVLVHVGQGCVASLPDAERALEVVTELLLGSATESRATRRLRVGLHRGPFGEAPTAVAEPTVAVARKLLELAGPGEALASAQLWDSLDAAHTHATPIPVWGPDDGESPTAYRLLLNPLAAAAPATRRSISGWRIAGAVVLSSVAVLAAVAVALLA